MLFRSNDTATTEIYTSPHTLSLHDALPTFIAAGVSLVTFVAVAYATKDSYSARTLTRDGRRTIVAGGDSEDE